MRVDGAPCEHIYVSATLPDYRMDPNGHYAIEAAYVSYAIPEDHSGETWLLVHGGGMSGTVWETTPDGRPGWREHLLAQGHAVYVIDMVERGRAGFCALKQFWPDDPLMRVMEEAWEVFRIGPDTGYTRRVPFVGQKFPAESFDQAALSWAPRWQGNGDAALVALELALNRIGPCNVIAHSSGCGHAVRLAQGSDGQIKHLVLIEPADLPGFSMPRETAITCVWGDFVDDHPIWKDMKSASLDYLQAIKRNGGRANWIELGDYGLLGHSHLLMQDVGNEDVLDIIVDLSSDIEFRLRDTAYTGSGS